MQYNDIIGTIGVGLILVAYFCNTFNLLKEGKAFFVLNAAGAGLACYASWLINYWPICSTGGGVVCGVGGGAGEDVAQRRD